METINGVWIANRPHSQVLTSQEETQKAIAFLQEAGFNTIFPVVWNRGYTLYPSKVMKAYGFPLIDPFYEAQTRDPLQEIISEAHRHHIKVIPWFEYGFAASHLLSGGHILQQKPQWKAITQDNSPVIHGSLTWMNGFNPEVQQFMLDLILELLTNYDVEGIQGCDRLPALPVSAGYDPYTVQKYQTEWGKKPPRNHQDHKWLQWRANILTDYLTRIYQEVKAVKPKAIVSLSPAVYPFCLQNLLQDSKTWIERGIVDILHPQIYRSSFATYQQEVKKIVKTFPKNSLIKFAPGIALKPNNQNLSQEDLLKCLELNRNTGFCGQVFFHYDLYLQNQL